MVLQLISSAFIELLLGVVALGARARADRGLRLANRRAAFEGPMKRALGHPPSAPNTGREAVRQGAGLQPDRRHVPVALPAYRAGAKLREAYPVVPLAEGDNLSTGMFSYREWMHFGLYADLESRPRYAGCGALERAPRGCADTGRRRAPPRFTRTKPRVRHRPPSVRPPAAGTGRRRRRTGTRGGSDGSAGLAGGARETSGRRWTARSRRSTAATPRPRRRCARR